MSSRELLRKGVRVRLPDQSFQVLAMLLEHRGQLVTREQIQQTLWPGDTFVDFNHGLNNAVNRLRDALGDTADAPRFIETLPRRGYRFLAAVNTAFSAEPNTKIAADVADRSSPLLVKSPDSSHVSTARTSNEQQSWAVRRRYQYSLPWLMAVLLTCTGLTAMLFLVLRIHHGAGVPRISSTTQLTFTGAVGLPFIFEWMPSIQTDGQRVFYNDGSGRIAYIDAEGGEPGFVQPDVSNLVLLHISPDNSTLMAREWTGSEGASESPLWLLPVNGGPRHRLGDIEAQDAAWSPDGAAIAFGQGTSLWLTGKDGMAPRKLTSLPGRPFWIRWSPTGNSLRFTVVNAKTGFRTLWETDLTGASHQLLVQWRQAGSVCCGIWSTQSGNYLFINVRDDQSQLWTLRKDSEEPVPVSVASVGVQITSLASSPKQHRLFVIGHNPQAGVYAVDLSSQATKRLLPGFSPIRVSFSKDGKWRLVQQMRFPNIEIWRERADGTGRVKLTSAPLRPFMSAFSPDASRVAIMTSSTQPQAQGWAYKIYWVKADGGTLHELRTDVLNQADPNWSADGQSIIFGEPPPYFADSGKEKAIYTSNVQSGITSKLPGSEGWFSPRISPDGSLLAAVSLDARRIGLFDLHTHRWRTLLETENVNGPLWAPDGHWIIYDDGADGIWRVRISDGHQEHVLSIPKVLPDETSCFVSGFTPDGLLLISCLRRYSDLYALDWEQ